MEQITHIHNRSIIPKTRRKVLNHAIIASIKLHARSKENAKAIVTQRKSMKKDTYE